MSTTKVSAALMESGTKGADIASAGTMVIGTDGGYFDITGTTGISTMTVAAGRVFTLQFDGVVTLTHSSTLYLSGAADFTTEANDHMTFISVAANDVRQIGTGLKDGGSPVAAAGGKILQVVHAVTTAVATGTTTMPHDDTIPQSGEGTEFLTLAITPASASNKLLISADFNYGHTSTGIQEQMALFQDSTAGALAAVGARSHETSGNKTHFLQVTHYMTAGTTSATTFKIRLGADVGATTTINGLGGVRVLGGVFPSTITIWEIEV